MFYKKIYCTPSKLAHLVDTASKFALFSVSGLKDEKLIKSIPAGKLKHANSVIDYVNISAKCHQNQSVHNFEPYRFKVGAFFLRRCSWSCRQQVRNKLATAPSARNLYGETCLMDFGQYGQFLLTSWR